MAESKKHTFPFSSKISLKTLIGYYEAKSTEENSAEGIFAREIIKRIDKVPALREPIEDMGILEEHREVVDLILSVVFPASLKEDEMLAVTSPYGFKSFASTKKLDNTIPFDGNYDNLNTGMSVEEIEINKTVHAYSNILLQCYGIDIPVEFPVIACSKSDQTGLDRYYKIFVNPKFLELEVKGELPKIDHDKIEELKQNIFDLDLWQELLPPERFEFHGFSIFHLFDVTDQEVLSKVKYNLLEKDTIVSTEKFKILENNLRILFKLPDLRVGIASIHKNQNDFFNLNRNICHSFIVEKTEEKSSTRCEMMGVYDIFKDTRQPIQFPDLQKKNELGILGDKILEEGIRNLVLIPLYDGDEFLGLIELGCPNACEINPSHKIKIQSLQPLFEIALRRSAEETANQIQAIIKEQYTAIHPSVEWRFEDAAIHMLEQKQLGISRPEPEDIVFKNVHPLFGASDIRSSSVLRNEAIRKDLEKQLTIASEVLSSINNILNLPILDETKFRIGKIQSDLTKGDVSDDGEGIINFLKNDIEPIFNSFLKERKAISEPIENYFKKLDKSLGIIYEERRAFENSVMIVNERISTFLDAEEEITQKMFPHYYEKYNTDGVEYNIYIGKSLVQNLEFDEMYLENLRLWQLIATCKIARLMAGTRPNLDVPLELAHLILVQSSSLSIKFRMDEKQFDVDGAYNVRYEIVKKRIDKAEIKGANERLTQPDMIAIVYSQDKDKNEYMRYLNYMIDKGYLEDKIEDHELNQLQGVYGLRALRVSIRIDNLDLPDVESHKLLDELLVKA
ncbi:MAG: GAF domain-containing protein [Bacteroidota bacterium]